jgi:hypothetical protein
MSLGSIWCLMSERLLAFLASDEAATITGAILNASSGMILD